MTPCVSATLHQTTREVKVQRFAVFKDDEVQRYISTMSADGWHLTALTSYVASNSFTASAFIVVMERNQ